MASDSIKKLEMKLKQLESQPVEEVGKEKSQVLNDLAYELYRSNPAKSEEYGRQALALAEGLGDENNIARSHLIIGIANIVRGNDGLGLEQSLRALSLYERIDNKTGIAKCCNYIGCLHSKRGDHDKALEYLFQALDLNEELDSKSNVAVNYNTIGTIYYRIGDYDKALKYLNKALALFDKYGTEDKKKNTYLDLGNVYYRQEKYGQALEYFQKVLKLAEAGDDKQSICVCLHNMGDVHLQWKRYDSALDYLERSLALAQKIESRRLEMLNYEFLSKLYEEQEDYKESFNFYKEYATLRAEIFSKESSEKIARLELKHEIDKKEKETEIFRLRSVELEAMVAERTSELEAEATERRQTLEALKKSEELHRPIWNNSPVGIALISREAKFTMTNPAFCEIIGYQEEELNGRPLFDLLVEEDDRLFDGLLNTEVHDELSNLYSGRPTELTFLKKSGKPIRVDLRIDFITDENGSVDYMIVQMTDITERRQAELALQESEERYRTLVETLHEGIGTVDQDENIVFANPAFCDILGYSQEEITRMNLRDFIPKEEFEEVLRQTFEREEGLSSQYEITIRRKDGELRQVTISASPWKNEKGDFQGTVGLLLDITEQKRSELALQESEERYRLISENTGDLISITSFSLNPVYTYVSPSIRVLGYEPEELIGKAGLNYIHPDDRKRLLPLLKNYVSAKAKKLLGKELGNTTEHLEYRFMGKEGNWHYLESTANLVGDSILFISRDVSERKQSEKALRESEEFNRAINENSPVGISIRSPRGKLISANAAWKQIWAVLDGELEEDFSRQRDELKLDERDSYLGRWADEVKQIYTEGGSLYVPELEVSNPRPGGALWVSQHFYSITNDAGKVERVVILTEDITERKLSELALRESERIYRLLYDTVLAVTRKSKLDEIVTIISDQATSLLNSVFSIFYRYDPEKNHLYPLYTNKADEEEEIMRLRLPLGSGLAGQVGAEKRGAISNYTDIDRHIVSIEGTNHSVEAVQSVIAEPVLGGEELLGVLLVGTNNDTYQEQDQSYLRVFARMAALVLVRAFDATTLSESEQTYRSLYDTTLTLANENDSQAVIEVIANQSTKLLKARDCMVMLVDHERGVLRSIFTNREEYRELLEDYELPLGSGLSGRVAQTGVGGFVNAGEKNENISVHVQGTDQEEDEEESIISVPMFEGDGRVLGVITIAKHAERFTEDHLSRLTILARQAEIALKRSRDREALAASEATYRALYKTTLEVTEESNLDKTIEHIVNTAKKLLNSYWSMYFRFDQKTKTLIPLYTNAPDARNEIMDWRLRLGEGLSGLVAQQHKGMYSNYNDRERPVTHIKGTAEISNTESVIAEPVLDGDTLLGVLFVSTREQLYTDDDLFKLRVFAQLVSISIKRIDSLESLAASEATYRALYNTALAITEEHNLEKTIKHVVDTIHDLFEAYWSCYFRYDEETETIATAYANTSENEDKVKALRIPLGAGLSGLVAARREGMYSNYNDENRPIANIGDTIDKSDIESLLAEPVLDGDKLLGVLFVSVKNRLYTDDDLFKLRVFARLTAVSIKRADSIESLAVSEATYRALYETTTALAEVNDLGEVTRVMVEQAAELLNARHCTFYRLTSDGTLLEPIQTTSSRLREEIMSFTLQPGEGLTGRTAVEGIGIISNYEDDESGELVTIPGTETADDDFESLICEPIKSGERVTGVLTLSTLHESFTAQDQEALRIFARLALIALSQAENRQELEDSETKHRTLIEIATDGIVIIQDGAIRFVNPSTEKLSGYSFEEMRGHPFLNIIAPEERGRMAEMYQRRMDGEEVSDTYETIGMNRNGVRVPIEVKVALFSYEGQPALLAMVRDITWRKESEKEMSKLSLAIKNSPSIVAITDTEGLLEYVNPRFTEVTGYSSSEVIGQNPRILNAGLQSKEFYRELWETVSSGNEWRGEFANRRKDGTVYWEAVRISAIINEKGEIVSYVKLAEDITERRQNEAELKKREVILETVSRLGDLLLRSVNWEANANAILRGLCKAADASRVYVFENSWREDDTRQTSQRFEWVIDGISAEMDNPELQNLSYPEVGFERWEGILAAEKLVHGAVRDFPQSERDVLDPQGIKSILIVPIYVGEEWWGFIGFDNCVSEEEWSASQVDALRIAASIIGSSIGRQRMVEELRYSAERYRLVVSNSPLGIAVCDTTGKLELVNESLVKMLGSPSVEATMQINAFNFPLLRKAGISKVFRTTLETGLNLTSDHFYKSKWGKETFVRFFLTPVRDSNEMIIGIQALAQDITEVKKAEESLRESEERLQAVFDYAPIAYFLQDLKGTLLDGNRAAEELTGYSREELTNKSFTQLKVLSTKDIARAVSNMMKNALGNATGPVEYTLNRKDGSKVPVAISAYPIKIKGKTIVLGVAVDLTEREKASEALANYNADLEREVRLKTEELNQAQAFLRSVIDGSRELLIVADTEGNLEIVNQATSKVTGYTEDEVLGKPVSIFYGDDDLESLLDIQRRLAAGETNIVAQVNIRCKDGSFLPVELSMAPILDGEGNFTGAVGVGRDIREIKQLRKALLQSEKLASTGQLAANIAHEVNNPLTIIKNYLHLASADLDKSSQNNEILAIIGEEVERIARIINGLLSFYRPENTWLAPTDINELIEKLLGFMRITLENSNITIKDDLQLDLPSITLTPDQLYQVLLNMVKNAQEAMPDGGELTISTKLRKTSLHISITDTGRGIKKDDLANIFDPFFTTKGETGTGLGLSISYGIIKSLDGDIKVTSKPGIGTTFTIVLPIN